jgi:hypothetical protein
VENQFERALRSVVALKNAEKTRRSRNRDGSNSKIGLWKNCESYVKRAA